MNPIRGRDFSLPHSVQTNSEEHSTSYPVHSKGLFPGGEVAEASNWHFHLHLALRLRTHGATPPLPFMSSWHSTQLIKHGDRFCFSVWLTYPRDQTSNLMPCLLKTRWQALELRWIVKLKVALYEGLFVSFTKGVWSFGGSSCKIHIMTDLYVLCCNTKLYAESPTLLQNIGPSTN